MRLCWISTLLLGLFHITLFPSSKGLEGEKKIGIDDVYKPRKWSQVRDGPYRMVVSSRDQENDEAQLNSRKGTRNRQGQEVNEDKEPKNDGARASSDVSKDVIVTEEESTNKQENVSPPRAQNDADGVLKSRGGERRKHKVKLDHAESVSPPQDAFEKNDKSTQRTVKLARKRERILVNENFRKAHRVSVPEGYFSTPNPSTLSHKIYNHFRPIDRGIPRESIIPFYDFGKKLSTGKTPSGINSIEGSSTPGIGGYEITTHKEDEEPYHENMDMSVVKLRAVERNSAPRVWPPLKNPEITAYFKTSTPSVSDEEIRVQSTTPLMEVETKVPVGTTQSATSTLPSIDPTITNIPTILPPEQSDLQTNESKAKSNVTPSRQILTTEIPFPVDVFSSDNNKTLESLKELPSIPEDEKFTQLPRPSPTAKILSTAVVTSVSVKETYRHPRIKGINTPDAEPTPRNKSVLLTHHNKLNGIRNITVNITSANQTNKVEPASVNIVPSTHRPALERIFINRTNTLYKNSSIQPTTIRPKFRSNIEFYTFATKVPTSTTTHKPVNRSLYSTFQREQQKNKFISLPHHKTDNNSRAHTTTNRANDTSNPIKAEPKSSLNINDSKSKMYLTIRSRLPNQSATFRSTFRRNGTKAMPPVLRVIATPSSYIEVPRIISRLVQNLTTTVQTPTTDIETTIKSDSEIPESTVKQTDYHPANSSIESKTESNNKYTVSTERYVITPSIRPKNENSPKIPESQREIRMNNHRMPQQEVTTEEVSQELTTLYYLSQDTTTETPENPSPTQSLPKQPINIVTIAHRPGHSKPGLSWIHLGQKNRTRLHDSAVEVAYSTGFGIAAYVLAALGVIPLILGGFVLLRQIFIKSKKKMLDESEYSSEYNRTPLPAKLPRIPSHAANWEGDKAASSLNPVQLTSNQGNVQHQNSIATNQHQSNQHQSNQHQSNQHQSNQHQNQHSSQDQLQQGKWEFPRDKLRLQTLLGEGNFGQVWKAEADDISGHEGLTRLVAVKTVKEGSGGREREDLLRELAIMKELGSHPNVVTLLGCCTDREPFLLIMEYVMYGKMLTFLREHRTRAHYFNFSDLNSALVSRDLTVFAYCVARGMEFLVSKGIIHRDLAARNILVDHNKLCKIADFGMSRNVHDTGEIYEQRPNRGALPIRWMAPEALHCSIFTSKSDVWSFGILVWEIITLGCTPYQTMGAREVMRRVREGYRLERPVHCSQDLYKVITRCWAADPSKRPTFPELKHDLATLLSDPQTNGACVDLDALTEEMSSHSC